jgi:hypothetical protein
VRKKTLLLVALLGGTVIAAEDVRQLAKLPPQAEINLREEMRVSLLQLNEVISLVVAGKVKEAGELAEKELGISAMGKNRALPLEARPGANMPPGMHQIGQEGHKDASAFAAIAATGDREKALAAIPKMTATCIACHYSYRIR